MAYLLYLYWIGMCGPNKIRSHTLAICTSENFISPNSFPNVRSLSKCQDLKATRTYSFQKKAKMLLWVDALNFIRLANYLLGFYCVVEWLLIKWIYLSFEVSQILTLGMSFWQVQLYHTVYFFMKGISSTIFNSMTHNLMNWLINNYIRQIKCYAHNKTKATLYLIPIGNTLKTESYCFTFDINHYL